MEETSSSKKVLALPIFPARLQASIFGASELNFRVRDGNGWTLTAINTNLLFLERKSKQKELYAFFFQEEGLRFNYRTLKTEQSNRRTRASACIPFLALNLRLQVKPSAY